MRRFAFTLLVSILALPLFGAGLEAGHIRTSDRRVPGQYIVVFEDGVADVEALSADLVLRHRGRRNHVYETALKGFSAELSEKAALAISQHPSVKYVEEDGFVAAFATQSDATWGLDRIDQRDLPLSKTYVYNPTGTGVTAYIIDTGINTAHDDFAGRAVDGFDAIDGSLPAADCNGHGTHVAGTVGGATWGVAKGVALVAVRVLSCSGSGSTSGVVAGVNWVAANHAAGTPAVANMSLGGGPSTALDTAVTNAIADGITFVLAAGNDNADACNYSPARTPDGITVGATTTLDQKASFSNYGKCLDIFAPGTAITSTWIGSTTLTNTISGTSMAAPHVAGAAALYLESNTTALPAALASALVDNATANKLPNPGLESPNRLLYTGFISGGAAPLNDVTAVEGDSGTSDFTFTVSLGSPAAAGGVTFDIATADGTATAGVDYVAKSLTGQTIPAGRITYTFTVQVNGDYLNETAETFFVNVTNVTNAVLADTQGQGTIVNDDPLPALSIDDVTVVEGHLGTVNAVFTVALSAASGQTVSVAYGTANGTAIQPDDYTATGGTLSFMPGQITRTFSVPVVGETSIEPDETFFVNLGTAVKATFADNQGRGTIVNDDVPIVVSPATLPMGKVGVSYGQTLSASGGLAPYSFGVTAGSLPPGLTFSLAGVLTGMPTAAGSFDFTATASDSSPVPGPFVGSQAYTLTVAGPTLALAPAATTFNAPYGAGYLQSFSASGGIGPYTYVQTGSLPTGLSFSGDTLSGTAIAPGSYAFTITATDNGAGGAGAPFSIAANYTVEVAAPVIVLDPATLPDGVAGTSYSQTLTASGGVSPYQFALTAGSLPLGLTLGSGGELSGTPGASGAFAFTVTAADVYGQTGGLAYLLTIAPPTLTLSPLTLPAGAFGSAYSLRLTASGGISPYRFSVSAGTLPAGFSLAIGGELSGTPAESGTFHFSVTAIDSTLGTPGTVTQAYELEIAAVGTIDLVLPAVARTAGSGTYFLSQIDGFNASTQPLTVAATFVPRSGTGGVPQSATFTLLPRATIALEDPFAAWFGLASGDFVGAIYFEGLVGDMSALALQSRIVAVNADGTEYGQYFPALGAADFIAAGETAWAPGPLSPERSRLNLGVMALEDGTTLELRPVGPIGAGLAAKQTLTLGRGQSQQVSDLAAVFGLGASANWLVEVTVLAGSAVAYGSEVDGNATTPGSNDPTTLDAFRAGARQVTLLEVGAVQGQEEYAGRALIVNLTGQPATVTATFYPRGQSGASTNQVLSLRAGEVSVVDVDFAGVGTLELDAGSGGTIAAIGREYSVFRDDAGAIAGTAGDRMPGLMSDDLLRAGAVYHLIGLRQAAAGSGQERSHLAAFNPGRSATTLRVRLYDADSGLLEGSDAFALGAQTLLQWNEIIAQLAPSADASPKRLEISADAEVFAAAFRVNADGDSVTIEPIAEP